jgi:hypothetical protein
MKIKLKELIKQSDGVCVSLIVEQEYQPFNNFTPTTELGLFETNNLTDNQIITMAWNKVKPNIITGMKRVNETLAFQWLDENLICEGFEYEEPTVIPIVVPPTSNVMSFEEMILWKTIEQNNRILELEKKLV